MNSAFLLTLLSDLQTYLSSEASSLWEVHMAPQD